MQIIVIDVCLDVCVDTNTSGTRRTLLQGRLMQCWRNLLKPHSRSADHLPLFSTKKKHALLSCCLYVLIRFSRNIGSSVSVIRPSKGVVLAVMGRLLGTIRWQTSLPRPWGEAPIASCLPAKHLHQECISHQTKLLCHYTWSMHLCKSLPHWASTFLHRRPDYWYWKRIRCNVTSYYQPNTQWRIQVSPLASSSGYANCSCGSDRGYDCDYDCDCLLVSVSITSLATCYLLLTTWYLLLTT